jgi:uncharacterized protein (TIGR02145 family)
VETKCGSNWYNSETHFCQNPDMVQKLCGTFTYTENQQCGTNDVVETPCGNFWYDASSQFCMDDDVRELCGGQIYTALQFCYGNSKVGYLCGTRAETFDPALYECREGNKIYLKTSVQYQEKNYDAVLIGEQTWFTENLNYDMGGSCYSGIGSDCTKYGRLYDWETANTFCPTGWHLPTKEEWDVLINFVEEDNATAAKHLKATSGWKENKNGLDTYGFAALPGGGNPGNDFIGIGEYSYWWSSSEHDSDDTNAHAIYMYYDDDDTKLSSFNKTSLRSVRCIMD